MARFILPSGREFTYEDSTIIQCLENAHKDIHDLGLLVYIQTLDTLASQKTYQTKSSAFLGTIGEAHIQNELTQLNIEWKNNAKTFVKTKYEIEDENEKNNNQQTVSTISKKKSN